MCASFSCLGALYIAEIASPGLRGSLGNCLSFSVALGITLVMSFGALLTWPILSLAGAIPQIIGNFSSDLLTLVANSTFYKVQDKLKLSKVVKITEVDLEFINNH